MGERKSLTEFLDNLVIVEQENVNQYETHHGDKLADIRSMNAMDAFLYGVANGKLDMAMDLRDIVVELLQRYQDGY